MAQPTIQTSFASGEWAPKLRSRVDVNKYKTGAAMLRNFFVDFSGGGASTRPGTRYIGTVRTNGARLVPFQPSVNISYVLEFGQNYIRFISNGAYIQDPNNPGNPLTITSPYLASDLFPNQATGNPGIKWVQDVTSLIICHPSYVPYILTIVSATQWTITAITFGPTITAPTNTTLGLNIPGTNWYYSYIVTAVDNNGQESVPSAPASGGNQGLINVVDPSNLAVSWTAVSGAVSYNVYKASPNYDSVVATGVQYGFVGNVTGTEYQESYPGIAPDFSQTPPIVSSPIVGGNVLSITLTGNTAYTKVPLVTIPPPASGFDATAYASLAISSASPAGVIEVSNLSNPSLDPGGQILTLPGGVQLEINAALNLGGGIWEVTGVAVANPGSLTGAGTSVPTNPVAISSVSGGFSLFALGTNSYNLTWHIGALALIQGGFGYTAAPVPTFSPAGATATTTVSPINQSGSGIAGATPVGNPRVPGFIQERLMLAAPNAALQSFYMSQPGSFFNYNVSNPSEDDDAIFGSIISEELNDIRSLLSVPTGMLALTGKGAWLINGGGGISTSNPITPSSVTATPQAFNGSNDLRPLKINFDALFVTNKGNYVRDANYNIYANIFTGEDITIISNHLFFGFQIVDWDWSEEPFKTVWAVRNDGQLLSLGFVKEQDLIGWAHHDTNGQFLSVCSVIETDTYGNTVDAVYVIVQRFINGSYVQYVERLANRYFPYGYEDSWSVDCALQTAPQASLSGTLTITGAATVGASVTLTDTIDLPFTNAMIGWIVRAGGGIYEISAFTSSSVVTATVVRAPSFINPYTGVPYPVTQGWTIWEPVTEVSGLTQLIGQTITGVADGAVVAPQVVSNTGTINLATAASKVTIGLAFLPQLQTLPLDLEEPTVQSKRKKLPAATLRVADTLGLQIGTSFANAVTIKDLQLGAIPSQSNGPAKITDLVNPSLNPTFPITDARQVLDQVWQEPGQLCIQQNLPYPATILSIMPEVTVGDTPK